MKKTFEELLEALDAAVATDKANSFADYAASTAKREEYEARMMTRALARQRFDDNPGQPDEDESMAKLDREVAAGKKSMADHNRKRVTKGRASRAEKLITARRIKDPRQASAPDLKRFSTSEEGFNHIAELLKTRDEHAAAPMPLSGALDNIVRRELLQAAAGGAPRAEMQTRVSIRGKKTLHPIVVFPTKGVGPGIEHDGHATEIDTVAFLMWLHGDRIEEEIVRSMKEVYKDIKVTHTPESKKKALAKLDAEIDAAERSVAGMVWKGHFESGAELDFRSLSVYAVFNLVA